MGGVWAQVVRSADVWTELEGAGAKTLILKGVATNLVVYDDLLARSFTDCDILVHPQSHALATKWLRSAGYRPVFLPADQLLSEGGHGGAWVRDGFVVDLHHTLPLVQAPAIRVWEEIASDVLTTEVAGRSVEMTGPTGCALMVALHAAANGPNHESSLEDLRTAERAFSAPTWDAAAAMASRLGVVADFNLGRTLATPSHEAESAFAGVDRRRKLHWEEAPFGARVIEEARRGNARARVRLIARTLVPSPRSLRIDTPIARRGRSGLVAAYALRPFRLGYRLPIAWRAWRDSRR